MVHIDAKQWATWVQIRYFIWIFWLMHTIYCVFVLLVSYCTCKTLPFWSVTHFMHLSSFHLNALWCFSIAESMLKAVWWLRAVFCIARGLKWGLSMLEACHTSWMKSKVTGFLKDRGSDANCHCTLQEPVHAKHGLQDVWLVCREILKINPLL